MIIHPCKKSLSRFLLALVVCITTTTNVPTAHAMLVPDPVVHFSVGAVAGGMGAFAAYPFDYIKSQMQTKLGAKQYTNGWDAFMATLEENPWNLYKGVGVQVLGIAPEKGIKLGVNDVLHTSFVTSMGGFPIWAQIVSGGVAGACQVVASSPLEVLKVGLQTSDMEFHQVWTQVGGFKGLFRGAEACILRDVLFTALCFPLYAALLDSSMNSFAAGAMSGVAASWVATPPDVIKTRILSQDDLTRSLQQSTSTASNTISTTSTTSTTDTTNPIALACQIVKQEGATVLFSGMNERLLGAIPRFGTTLAMHDALEQFVSSAGWLSSSSSHVVS